MFETCGKFRVMNTKANFILSRLPTRIETYAERFALFLSGGNKASLKAKENHTIDGRVLFLASIFVVLYGVYITDIWGALTLLVISSVAWSVFFLGQGSLSAQQKSASQTNTFYRTVAFLSLGLRQTCRSRVFDIKSSIIVFLSAALFAVACLFIAIGRLSHICISPRILPAPIAAR